MLIIHTYLNPFTTKFFFIKFAECFEYILRVKMEFDWDSDVPVGSERVKFLPIYFLPDHSACVKPGNKSY